MCGREKERTGGARGSEYPTVREQHVQILDSGGSMVYSWNWKKLSGNNPEVEPSCGPGHLSCSPSWGNEEPMRVI